MADRYRDTLYAGDTDTITIPVTHGDGGSNVLLSEISTVTFTLKDLASGTVVNSRSAQSVLNLNNWTIANGSLAWSIQAADTTLLSSANSEETHRGELMLTLSDGQKRTCVIDLICRKRPYS